MKIYHVCETDGGWDGLDLLSLEKQHGEEEAFRIFGERWPEGDPQPDIYQVHCFTTLKDAQDWVASRSVSRSPWDAEILEIDTDELEEDWDAPVKHREGHMAVHNKIPARFVRRYEAQ